MKEQARKYYYIDRKLVSSDEMEVLEGLNEINVFIDTLQVSEILNSIIMRLIDLFTNSKTSCIKVKSAHIMKRLSTSISELPSKLQFTNNLYKNLKSPDEIVRILTMQIIQRGCNLFVKQNSVYHLLLAKLRKNENQSIKEKISVVKCLKALLSSSLLSNQFSNNLKQLKEIGGIQLKFLMFLSLSANFDDSSYPHILMTFWSMISEPQSNYNQITHYFKQFLIRAVKHNFKCYAIYEQLMKQNYPDIQPIINRIKAMNFSFFAPSYDIVGTNDEMLLDYAYSMRYLNNQEELSKIENIIQQRINNYFLEEVHYLSSQIILLSFYCHNNFDQLFAEKIQFIPSDQSLKYLKICLVTANFNTVSLLLDALLNILHCNYTPLLLLHAYTQFHLTRDLNELQVLLQMMETLAVEQNSQNFLKLQKKWRQLYLEGTSGSQMKDETDKQRIKTKLRCFHELQAIECENMVEVPIRIQNQHFKYIYFTKKTILQLCGLMNQMHTQK